MEKKLLIFLKGLQINSFVTSSRLASLDASMLSDVKFYCVNVFGIMSHKFGLSLV